MDKAEIGVLVTAVKKNVGSGIDTQDGSGRTMLHHALHELNRRSAQPDRQTQQRLAEVVVYLMQQGADPSLRDEGGQSAADFVLSSGHNGVGSIQQVVTAVLSHARRGVTILRHRCGLLLSSRSNEFLF